MDTWRTQGGNCDGKNKKNKRQHSTSYFSGTGKRHGLVVVSGMALGGNSEERGNTEGRIVLISISQTLHRNTFNFSLRSLESNAPGAAEADSQAADVWASGKKH